MYGTTGRRASKRTLLFLGLVLVPASASASGQSPGVTAPSTKATIGIGTRLFVVDDTPSACRFSASIQDAVNAAGEGDVVLVKGGSYQGVTIDGKSLCVIGEGSPFATYFQVRSLRADQRVVLRGFQTSSASFADNSGPIWVEDCSWALGASSYRSLLGLFRCRSSILQPGPTALDLRDSTVFAYHSFFQGAPGSDARFDDWLCASSGGLECDWSDSSPGVAGILLRRGSMYLFGCSASGGRGGHGENPSCGGYANACGVDYLPGSCGGSALDLDTPSSTVLLESQLASGPNATSGCNQTAVSGSGSVTILRGKTGEFSLDSPVRAGSPLRFRIKGPPGRKVFVSYAFDQMPRFDQPRKGLSVVPAGTPDQFIGLLPASGQLDITRSFGDLLDPGTQAAVFFVESQFYDPITCSIVLGSPSALVVVRDPCP